MIHKIKTIILYLKWIKTFLGKVLLKIFNNPAILFYLPLVVIACFKEIWQRRWILKI